MSVVGKNIKRLREHLRLTQEQFGLKFGATRAAISSYEELRAKPKVEVADAICQHFGLKISDLYEKTIDLTRIKVDRNLPYDLKREKIAKAAESNVAYPKNKGVPVYNIEFTGGDIEQLKDFPELIKGYIDLDGYRMCIAFVYLRNDSMYPDFKAGDLIGLEPQMNFDLIQYGMPFGIVTKDNQRMVKFVRKGKDDSHLILRSKNENYDDISLHKNKIDKLFRAHGPIRDPWQ